MVFIDHGFDIMSTNEDDAGNTLLHYSIKHNQRDVLEFLLNKMQEHEGAQSVEGSLLNS